MTDSQHQDLEPDRQQTLLEQLGGISGLVYSTVPVVVFVPANALFGLTVAIWSALGAAAAILVLRLVRREPIQPAISAFIGVGICAYIAHRMGDAKGYFVLGIYTNLAYGVVFVISILARWPLVGALWGLGNGLGTAWRRDRTSLRAYDVATAGWALVFGLRYVVQSAIYRTDHTGFLAFARIVMGWPLAVLAVMLTVWAVRRSDRALAAARAVDVAGHAEPPGAADATDEVGGTVESDEASHTENPQP